ncbi:MAG: DUF2937 family protein [Nitratireductor sp.]
MGITSKFGTLIAGLLGVGVFSQAPEFTQQYKQRLGGAVNELGIVVSDFDKNAKDAELTRDEALQKLTGSSEQFVQDRGQSMSGTISRFERLNKQKTEFENSNIFMQPILLAKSPDLELVEGTYAIYKPAVPLTAEGGAYGGVGGLLGLLLARFLLLFRRKEKDEYELNAQPTGRGKQSPSDKALVKQINASRRQEIRDQDAQDDLVFNDDEDLQTNQKVREPLLLSKNVQNTGYNAQSNDVNFAGENNTLEDSALDRVHFRQKLHGEIDIHGQVVKLAKANTNNNSNAKPSVEKQAGASFSKSKLKKIFKAPRIVK